MTEEERGELQAKRNETERRIAERYKQLFAPIRAFEDALSPLRGIHGVLDQVRKADETMASVRLAQDAVDASSLSKAVRQLSGSPVTEALRALSGNPMTELTRSLQENVVSGLARNLDRNKLLGGIPSLSTLAPTSHVSFSELAGVDRLQELTRDLGHSEDLSPPMVSPHLFAPIRPPRDVDQDERFDGLTEVVVAQTEQVVELRKEVREVKDSASRDAHRERKRSIRSERTGARLQWWHMLVASFLSAILGALATKFIVGG